ncbi:hypothetical protein A2W14_01545, partial [Candidatus Gottesmanbacteria bacterium RBG_16_37_8]
MPVPESVSELEKKINDFLEYLEVEKGSSNLTLRNYRHYLLRYLNYAKEQGLPLNLKGINLDNVHEYRKFLSRLPDAKDGTLSRKTQGFHIIAIRSFLRYLIKNNYQVLSPDSLELPKIADRQIKFLTGDQVDKLLNAPTLSTLNGQRDKAIMEVFFSTGLRVSELVKLNRDKINLSSREFGIVGKGGKARVVFMSQRACDWVKKYLDAREDRFKPLFIRHKGKIDPATPDENMRLTPRSVQRMIKKYVRKVK